MSRGIPESTLKGMGLGGGSPVFPPCLPPSGGVAGALAALCHKEDKGRSPGRQNRELFVALLYQSGFFYLDFLSMRENFTSFLFNVTILWICSYI